MSEDFRVGMDTGGTFTDGFFSSGQKITTIKVDTTPHDLTVCFMNCLEEGAKKLGFADLGSFLKKTDIIKFSSTIGSNTLIQKSGPKLGLIVTKGFEETLYCPGTKPTLLNSLVQPGMVVGVEDEITDSGQIVIEPSDKSVRRAVEYLLQNGARIIVVSLRRAFISASNERKVKEIIHKYFPGYYLGSVPVLISTQISWRPDDHKRTNAALLNAYFHKDMVTYLYKAEANLRKLGYHKPLFVVQNNGGVSRVAKSRAIDTYGSGPTAGVVGSTFLTQLYDLGNVVTMDIGGTSTDVGVIRDKKFNYDLESEINEIPIGLPTIQVFSVGGGGGSKASAHDGVIQVGPQSMGAMPGPACFDLGGTEATPTDANIVLGYLDPNYFLGGRRKLNANLAYEAIGRLSDHNPNQVAIQIRGQLEELAATVLQKLLNDSNLKPDKTVMFAFGGGAGCHCCGIAEKLGIKQILTFSFSPVFCAFGATLMDTAHFYEYYRAVKLSDHSDYGVCNEIVSRLQRAAIIDMTGEGFHVSDVNWELEVQLRVSGKSQVVRFALPTHQNLNAGSLIKNIGSGPIVAEFFRLKAYCKSPNFNLPTHPSSSENAEGALKARREVHWNDRKQMTPIYDKQTLRPGNIVYGPAIIEGDDTTYVVTPGWSYETDRYLNGLLTRR